jgi:hypothetical protein
VLGGPRVRTVTPLIDHLTGVQPSTEGTLQQRLLELRRARGGTSLVVVTGALDLDDLPYIASLRRRFDRLVMISVDSEHHHVDFPGVTVIVAADADGVSAAWNLQALSVSGARS